jgi:PAS domain S-box-containing protein
MDRSPAAVAAPDDDLLAAAFEVAGVGVCFTDERGSFIRVNPKFCTMLGYAAEELIGRPWTMIAPPDVVANAGRFLGALLKNSPNVPDEWRIRRKDGGFLVGLVSFRTILRPDARRVIIITFTDIHARKQAEEELRASEQRFRQISETISEVFWMTDPAKQTMLYVSPAYERVWGRSVASLYAEPASFLDAIHPADRERVTGALPKQVLGGYDETYRVVRPDGTLSWVRDRAFPVRDAEGRVVRVTGIAADITTEHLALDEIKRLNRDLEQRVADRTAELTEKLGALEAARAALARSEALYRDVVNNVSEGIMIVQDARMVFANPRVPAITGYPLEELIARPFVELIHPEDRDSAVDRYVRRMRGEPVDSRVSFRIVHKSGRALWIELSVVMMEWHGRPATLSFMTDMTARKRAEEALRRSEENYRNVIENMGEGLVVAQGPRIVLANPSAERLAGYTLDELASLDFIETIIHPDDRPMAVDRYRRRMLGEPVDQHYAFRIVCKDGAVKWVEISAVRIDWHGAPATLSFLFDVTERLQLEAKLKRTLEEREVILESSIVAIVFLNREHRMVWANRAAEHMFGFDRQAWVGRSIEPFYPSREAYAAAGSAIAAAVLAGRSYEAELEMRRSDGTSQWVYLSGKAVSATDLSLGTVWAIMDISERKALEDELRRTASEREAILENARVGITYVVGRTYQWVNRAFAELVGCDPREMVGMSTRMFYLDQATWARVGAEAYPRFLEGRAYATEVQGRRTDGTLFWAQIHGGSVEPGHPERGTIWSVVNVTERRRAQEDMRRALEKQRELADLKSRFVSMTSHEFRTPLAAIQSSAELLRDYWRRLPEDERAELVGIIAASVRRMSGMLDNVLAIGRADAEKLEFNPQPLDLEVFCAALVEEVQRAAETPAAAEVRVSVAGASRAAHADEKLLRHILGNLLGNALKYSPGGAVHFEVDCRPDAVAFTVADRGIGIPEDDLPHLFEAFHRARNVGAITGTGLGLAIVKRCVDLHGGTIEVESRLGEGTRFVVTLPRVGG